MLKTDYIPHIIILISRIKATLQEENGYKKLGLNRVNIGWVGHGLE